MGKAFWSPQNCQTPASSEYPENSPQQCLRFADTSDSTGPYNYQSPLNPRSRQMTEISGIEDSTVQESKTIINDVDSLEMSFITVAGMPLTPESTPLVAVLDTPEFMNSDHEMCTAATDAVPIRMAAGVVVGSVVSKDWEYLDSV